MLAIVIASMLATQPPAARQPEPISAADRASLAHTSVIIREAFARGDAPAAMACHHADVEKSFGADSRLIGKAAVADTLTATLAANKLEFVSNETESLLVIGDVAIEQTRFAIRGTPKAGGEPWTFKGRTQVVYLRDASNPCGWATIREIVQPS
jgi:ketosteroid isomerase-like protein